MVKLIVDNEEVEVPKDATIMDACKVRGTEIPHFCYHPDLSIAGNCRMCLVEVQKIPKPVASCAYPVQEGMIVNTNSEMVELARKNVLELLLINHPLDCPVCDQGGECGLQDQTMAYGKGIGDYTFERRLVPSKNMGPLIGTVMTRCIHCTRCVRFMDEIAGTGEIGAVFRGEETEITTYLESNISSELSGNIIDICPVGALTSKPYAFQGRPWELQKIDSIDVLDAVGSNIQIHVRGENVMRILPRDNRSLNDCWISDKTRFSYDALSKQRLDRPYVRRDGKLQEATWEEAFSEIKRQFKNIEANELAALSGELTDCESAFMLKEFMATLGSPHLDGRPIHSQIDFTNRGSYLFNSTIKGIDESDCILLVATNPRIEATMINARIRKRFLKGNIDIGLIGPECALTYDVDYLGNSATALKDILDKNHIFSKKWFKAKKPMIIIGQAALHRRDSKMIMHTAQQLCMKADAFSEEWNGYNILHTHAGVVSAIEVGFAPGQNGYNTETILKKCQIDEIKALYLLGVDSLQRSDIGDNTFVIYQGHHGDNGAKIADVILPGAAYTEKDASYVNTEGRVQRTKKALNPPHLAKEDWKIIRALAGFLNVRLPYDTIEQIRQKLAFKHPNFLKINEISVAPLDLIKLDFIENLSSIKFEPFIKNYFMTDVITRQSSTMADCIKASLQNVEVKS